MGIKGGLPRPGRRLAFHTLFPGALPARRETKPASGRGEDALKEPARLHPHPCDAFHSMSNQKQAALQSRRRSPSHFLIPSLRHSFVHFPVSHPPLPEIRTVTYTPSGSSVDKGFSLVPYSNSRRTSRFVAPFVILLIVKKGLALPTDEFE